MQDKITAALKNAGRPISPGELAKLLDMEASALGYHVKKMLDAGSLKAAGASHGRRIGLPEQDFSAGAETSAPPQRRKKHRTAKHAKKPKAAHKPRAARAAARPAERFIPTVDAERRLVIVNGREPLIFTDDQTQAIASLLFNHYDKEG